MTESLNALVGVEKEVFLNDLASKVVLPYCIIAIVLVLLAFFIYKAHLPEILINGNKEDNKLNTGKNSENIFKAPAYLWLGFVAIFLYVGVEVMAGDIIQVYGNSIGISMSISKNFTTYTMIGMLAGYLVGIFFIPKYLKQNTALIGSAILGIIFSIAAIYTHGYTSVLFIALLGLANALVWPAVWPLAIEGLGSLTQKGSALLIVGIAGGAFIPKLWASIGEKVGLQNAFWIMVPCYLFILFFAAKGNKIGKKPKS